MAAIVRRAAPRDKRLLRGSRRGRRGVELEHHARPACAAPRSASCPESAARAPASHSRRACPALCDFEPQPAASATSATGSDHAGHANELHASSPSETAANSTGKRRPEARQILSLREMDRARRWRRAGSGENSRNSEGIRGRRGLVRHLIMEDVKKGVGMGVPALTGEGGIGRFPPCFLGPEAPGGPRPDEPLEGREVPPIARQQHPERVSAVLLVHDPEGGPRGRDRPGARVGDPDPELLGLRATGGAGFPPRAGRSLRRSSPRRARPPNRPPRPEDRSALFQTARIRSGGTPSSSNVSVATRSSSSERAPRTRRGRGARGRPRGSRTASSGTTRRARSAACGRTRRCRRR